MSGFVKNVCAAAHIRHQLAHSPGSARAKLAYLSNFAKAPPAPQSIIQELPAGLSRREQDGSRSRGACRSTSKYPGGLAARCDTFARAAFFLGQKALKWDFLFEDLWNRIWIGMSFSSSRANADDSPSTRAQSLNRSELPGK